MRGDAFWRAKVVELRKAAAAGGGVLPSRLTSKSLGQWATNQRLGKKAMDEGVVGPEWYGMTPARAAELNGIPGWEWSPHDAAWREKHEALKAYVGAHGRLPRKRDPSGLGDWVNNQRVFKRAADQGRPRGRRMTQQRVAALEAVPHWTWSAAPAGAAQ